MLEPALVYQATKYRPNHAEQNTDQVVSTEKELPPFFEDVHALCTRICQLRLDT